MRIFCWIGTGCVRSREGTFSLRRVACSYTAARILRKRVCTPLNERGVINSSPSLPPITRWRPRWAIPGGSLAWLTGFDVTFPGRFAKSTRDENSRHLSSNAFSRYFAPNQFPGNANCIHADVQLWTFSCFFVLRVFASCDAFVTRRYAMRQSSRSFAILDSYGFAIRVSSRVSFVASSFRHLFRIKFTERYWLRRLRGFDDSSVSWTETSDEDHRSESWRAGNYIPPLAL